jgi:uncharacterized membrane protein
VGTWRFRLAQLGWDLRASMLVVPAVITVLLGTTAVVLEQVEVQAAWRIDWLDVEPGTAQVVLATLAGAMMTVISVVYSVLLVALSLASVQFSTRIVSSMVRDPVSQGVLGLFLGTFVWLLVALRSIDLEPAFVPPLTVAFALVLSVSCLGALVLFIDRVVNGIQANHLLHRIAAETEIVIDECFPPPSDHAPHDTSWPAPSEGAATVVSRSSGYVQLVSRELAAQVASTGCVVHLLRPMGSFVPEGTALWAVSPASQLTPAALADLLAAVDLGPTRTMQEDAEFGFRQIVDIGLKAISPAVNDPSTGTLCIDQLSRLLIRAGRRGTPRSEFPAGSGGMVVVPGPVYSDLVDLAFDQLRQYGRGDLAIGLRLLRGMADTADCIQHPDGRARLLEHGRMVAQAARASFPTEDLRELDRRWQRLERCLTPRDAGR